MDAVRQAVRVALVGLALGAGLGVIRGFPTVPDEAQVALCTPGEPDQPAIAWISQEEALALHAQRAATFADARPRDAYHVGHVAGSVSVPISEEPTVVEELDGLRGARTVITYCDTGDGCAESTQLAQVLLGAGLPDVRVLVGGMPAWNENHYPAEAGQCGRCQ